MTVLFVFIEIFSCIIGFGVVRFGLNSPANGENGIFGVISALLNFFVLLYF